MLFCDTVASLRREAGLTQEELGRKVGLSASAISRLEGGAKVPRSQDLVTALSTILLPTAPERLLDLWQEARRAFISTSTSRSDSSRTIAIISLDPSFPYMGELLHQLARRAKSHNLTLRFEEESSGPGQGESIARLAKEGIDGVILTATRMNGDECARALAVLDEAKIPLVLLNRSLLRLNDELRRKIQAFKYFGVVRAEAKEAYSDAVNALVKDSGCKEIWYLGGSPASETEHQRCQVLREIFSKEQVKHRMIMTSSWDSETGYHLMKEKLGDPGFTNTVLPLGVMAYSDDLAFGVWRACQKQRLKVPEEVAIVGGYHPEIGRFYPHRVTSVRFPTDAMADKALDLLDRLSEEAEYVGQDLPELDREAVVSCVLEFGDSTAEKATGTIRVLASTH